MIPSFPSPYTPTRSDRPCRRHLFRELELLRSRRGQRKPKQVPLPVPRMQSASATSLATVLFDVCCSTPTVYTVLSNAPWGMTCCSVLSYRVKLVLRGVFWEIVYLSEHFRFGIREISYLLQLPRIREAHFPRPAPKVLQYEANLVDFSFHSLHNRRT